MPLRSLNQDIYSFHTYSLLKKQPAILGPHPKVHPAGGKETPAAPQTEEPPNPNLFHHQR